MCVRVVLTYQHALFRDAAMALLGGAGIDVAASIRSSELTPEELQSLQPNVVVIERSATTWSHDSVYAAVFDTPLESIVRVIVIDSATSTVLIYRKQLVRNATAQHLIEATGASANEFEKVEVECQ